MNLAVTETVGEANVTVSLLERLTLQLPETFIGYCVES